VDEQLETLRRAVSRDPGDRVQAIRYAGALERAGRFEEAWKLLDGIDAREELATLARRNPGPVLERLRALDYRRARLMLERLASIANDGALLERIEGLDDPVLTGAAERVFLRGAAPLANGQKKRALLLMPWLVPVLASRNQRFIEQALDLVHRLARRDDLARSLQEHQGEPA
jgi:hypothetical protein